VPRLEPGVVVLLLCGAAAAAAAAAVCCLLPLQLQLALLLHSAARIPLADGQVLLDEGVQQQLVH
jgi:hypothetical protein